MFNVGMQEMTMVSGVTLMRTKKQQVALSKTFIKAYQEIAKLNEVTSGEGNIQTQRFVTL